MHPIQQHILRLLALNPSLRFSQLKPTAIESNLFMYHLRKLMGEGLVQKIDQGYELSREGCQYVESSSLHSFTVRMQPKIVTFVACENAAGEWLLYRRKHHPYIGRVGFPYGKIYLGEGIHHSAKRELFEKTGLEAELTHRGDVYITTYQKGELLTQMFGHVFYGKEPKGSLKEHSEIGECFWQKLTDLEDTKYFPGFKQLYRTLQEPGDERFFQELICQE